MKKIYSVITSLLITTILCAQAPQKMSYQAVIRNVSNSLVTSSAVGMKISILQGSISGSIVYAETIASTTNANGLVSLEIGTGAVVTGTFASINWAAGPYFIKTETDPTGGTAYTITGTNELMSVPYALFAANSTPGPAGPVGPIGPVGPTGALAPLGGFTHYLGELFNGGIIFYLYKGSDGFEHGLIVATTETICAWQSTVSLVNADRRDDGFYNTNLMTFSPAKTYINSLGTGWYLPSIDELFLLFALRYNADKALRQGGYNILSTDGISGHLYWSSTENNLNQAKGFFPVSGGYGDYNKTDLRIARAIRAF
jgi:hypothetical protein